MVRLLNSLTRQKKKRFFFIVIILCFVGFRGKWDFCLAEFCVFLLFVGVFYTFFILFRLPWAGGRGKKVSKTELYCTFNIKYSKYHGILICSLNQSIKTNPFRVLFHGVYEKESLYVKKDLFF